MTWPTLPTLTDGGTPTAAQLNLYLDALDWLHEPPTVNYEYDGTANFTTTGTTWGTVSSNFSTAIVCAEGATLLMSLGMTITRAEIDVSVDGTRLGGTAGAGTGIAASNSANHWHPIQIFRPFFDMSAGTHTFEVQFKAFSGATAQIHAGYRPRFHVREL